MKNIKSLATILIIWAAGELLSLLLKPVAAIPGSIIGMILLFILLMTKVVKLNAISETADFFLKHITLIILPFGVAFVKYWDVIKANLLVMILVGVISTVISLVLTMKFVDVLILLVNKRNEKKAHE